MLFTAKCVAKIGVHVVNDGVLSGISKFNYSPEMLILLAELDKGWFEWLLKQYHSN